MGCVPKIKLGKFVSSVALIGGGMGENGRTCRLVCSFVTIEMYLAAEIKIIYQDFS